MSEILKQITKDQQKKLIVNTLKNKKPESVKQLITLMQKSHDIKTEETTNLLIELENEGRLYFTKQRPKMPDSKEEFPFITKVKWHFITIVLAISITIAVFAIPDFLYPLVYVRSGLGIIFLLFLPGFTFTKALFPAKVPFKASSEKMGAIECLALSFVTSLAIVPLVCFGLNYTPWGIRLITITLSLLVLIIVFATTSILREYNLMHKHLRIVT